MVITKEIITERIAELEASASKIAGALNEAKLFLRYLEVQPDVLEAEGKQPLEAKPECALEAKE